MGLKWWAPAVHNTVYITLHVFIYQIYIYIYIYTDVKFDEVGIVDSLYGCALQNHLSRDI